VAPRGGARQSRQRAVNGGARIDYGPQRSQEALDYGNFDKMAEATAEIAALETRRAQLQQQEQHLERIPVPPADPVEAYCANRTAPTQQWLRSHPDFVTDRTKNARLTSAHWAAQAEGIAPDTAQYFEFVEKKVGIRGGRASGGSDGGGAAVVKHDPNTHVMNGGRNVYLTQGEAERADDGSIIWNYGPNKGKPIGREEFARRKAAMVADGRYNRMD